jgi:Protein of unknown function (DUF4232)
MRARIPARRLIIALTISSAAIGLPAATLAAHAAPASGPGIEVVPQCHSASLEVWLGLNPDGAAGPLINYPLEFTNSTATHTCWVGGFPTVHAVNGSGHKIGPRAEHGASSAHRIVLQPGQTAYIRLGVDIKGFVRGCHNANGAGLTVAPPGGSASQPIMSFSFPACTNKVFMTMLPFKAGVGIP